MRKLDIRKAIVTISPNPSNGYLGIQIKDLGFKSAELKIYNVLGECIYKSTIINPKFQIDLSSQPHGIYFYKVGSLEGMIATGKIVISN